MPYTLIRDRTSRSLLQHLRLRESLDKLTGSHTLTLNDGTCFSLLPFGIGKRTCPGETFARTRLFLLITTLLQRFDFLPPKNGEVVSLDKIPWTPGAVLLPPRYHCSVRRRTTL